MNLELLLVPHPFGEVDDLDAALVPADAGSPQLLVTDLGVNRGDGIFEVAGVFGGHIQALDLHLARFARSAHQMDLPAPNLALFERAVRRVVAAFHAAHPEVECAVKWYITRGQEIIEEDPQPHGVVFAYAAADVSAARQGIRTVLLSRSWTAQVLDSPWLLAGVKSLAYAVNRAAVREAVRRGADDAIWYSADDHLLEGSTSSLLVRIGDELITPPISEGILPGTTQRVIFDYAEELGLRAVERPLLVREVTSLDGAWLVSSSRLASPITEVDGVPIRTDPDLTRAMTQLFMTRDLSRSPRGTAEWGGAQF